MTVQLRHNAEELVQLAAKPATRSDTQVKGGIAEGTLILTAKGETPVEALQAGDRIITRERGMATLQAVHATSGPACAIRTDSLGLARPERDTTVAADQHVTLRDWRAQALFDAAVALVPANRLVDGKQIAPVAQTKVFRLEFDVPLTVYANGLETPTGRTEGDVIDLTDDI
ncbi:MAG: Hint domain-containing protein [Pseudomonadota bacterium]